MEALAKGVLAGVTLAAILAALGRHELRRAKAERTKVDAALEEN